MFWKQLYSFISLCVIAISFIAIVNGLKLEAVAPLNPVKEGDILSLRCQVWDLDANSEDIKIARHSETNSQVFTYNKHLVGGIDERAFLAVRQLRDGSSVYFLSIIDVQQDDEGTFTCKIMNRRHDKVVAESSVVIKTMFFPSESSPTCYPQGQLAVNEGSVNTLNCSSEKGNPPVDIEWVQTRSDNQLTFTKPKTIGSTRYSLLTLRPTMQDRDSMYTCRITSKHFPEEVRLCHVGPLVVHPSSDPIPIRDYMITNKPEVVTSRVRYELDMPIDRQSCAEYCKRSSLQSLHFWVVCTGVAAVFAIVFFVIGIVLLIKYRSTSTKPKVQYVSHHQGRDDVYTELEMRHDANKVYMAITKPPDEMVYCPKENIEEVQEQQVTEPPENKVRYV